MTSRISLCVLFFIPGGVQAQYDYGYHSSTLEEGVQRGAADIVRSYGRASVVRSKGAEEFEAGRSQYHDNEYKATTNYCELRRYVAKQRRSLFMHPLSMDQYIRL